MRTKGLRYLASGVLAAGALLGTQAPAGAATQPSPLIVVMMENHGYSAVIGNSAMPYLNGLWNEGTQKTGPVMDYTQMYATTTSSMPNYLAITSGSTDGATGNTSYKVGEFNVKSLWDQLTTAGISWGVFEEGMPTACYSSGSYNDTSAGGSDGQYSLGHNPGTLYKPIYTSAECQQDKPLSALSTTALPQVSFVTPNNCDNAHGLTSSQLSKLPFKNCVTGSTALLQRGDTWLKQHVTTWTGAGANVLVTWDEGGHLASLLTGPGVTPGQDSTKYSHYSVLAGIEKLYGLPLLANAATVSAVPLPAGSAAPAPPQVSITTPTGGSTVGGTVTVSGTAQAQGTASISKVQVSVDGGTPQTASGTTSWTTSIDTTALTDGSHTITAQATDSNAATSSATVTVNVSNTTAPPQVSITTPTGGSTVGGTVTVSGTAQAQGTASISKVQVSVDGGTPQTASGTTSWTTSIDTTALTDGSHTITAQATDSNAATSSATVTVNVSNTITTSACPGPPAGGTEFSGNVSVESDQTGWTGVYNGNSVPTRVRPAGGSYDGLWAIQVALKSGTSGTAGVNNAKPFWVPGAPGAATTAGQAYTGSAVVRASTAGEKISLMVREVTTAGKGVGYHTTTITVSDTGWHQISSAYTAKNTGDELRYYLYASNLANSGQNFLADCLSIQQP